MDPYNYKTCNKIENKIQFVSNDTYLPFPWYFSNGIEETEDRKRRKEKSVNIISILSDKD